MSRYVIALDQGTTSCRAIVFNAQGEPVRMAQQEFTQYFPQAGWVEHDAAEIWRVQLAVLEQAVDGIDVQQLAAIGITNQRETTVVWDRHTGEPLHHAIVWQCRRTADRCEQMKQEGWEQRIREKTGLIIDPYFSATKLAWLLECHPEWRERGERGDILFGTMDSWLIWKLTNGQAHVTDYSNASRTMLCNIHTLNWDEEIIAYLNIPRAMLPQIKSSSEIYGHTSYVGGSIPVAGAAGDQQASLFGQGCHEPGMAKNTYGTGCFLLMNTGETAVASEKGLLTTIAWGVNGKVSYALEGSVFIGGAVIQWLRDGLGLIADAAETEALATSIADTEGVYFVPAFTGLGTPYWNPYARGMISGLSRGSGKPHLVRAALEAIAYQSMDVLDVMAMESGRALAELRVDGGAVRNGFLMQFQADLLNAAVIRPVNQETTALGAAFLAGLAVGVWDSTDAIRRLWRADRAFTPQMAGDEREAKLAGWRKALSYQL